MEQKDRERRDSWFCKFQDGQDHRRPIFTRIYDNLTITSIENGISSLRRLEIRFLPLDPSLVSHLFRALQVNLTLQELILTDECLQFCKPSDFHDLFTAIRKGAHSKLALLDLSHNAYSFDDDLELHDGLVAAIVNQQREQNFLETLILTS